MRTFLGILTLLLTLMIGFGAEAVPVLANQPVYAIKPGTQTFAMIEDAVENLFRSSLREPLCAVMPSSGVIYIMTGVSAERAARLAQYCPSAAAPAGAAKVYPRTYYVAYDPDRKSEVQSWTTAYNQTILFVDDQVDLESLEKILAHEIAISADSKMNMYLTTYQRFEGKQGSDSLKKAFNASVFQPFSYAFATMRAMNIEAVLAQAPMTTARNHEQCVATFKGLQQFFLANFDKLREAETTIPGLLAQAISQSNVPDDLEATLANLMDSTLRVESRHGTMSFCQYMAWPSLGNASHHSLMANGPRPRVTGGWGDGKSQEKIDPVFKIQGLDKSVDKKAENSLGPASSKKLILEFKSDRSKQKLQELFLKSTP